MPARKPAGAKSSWSPSKGQQQCGLALVVIIIIVGLSYVFSPKPKETPQVAPATGTKGFAGFSVVTELKDNTFDAFMAAHPDGVLVDFYSDGCKFCTQMAPEFENAATQMKAEGGPPFVAINAKSAPQIREKFDISKYPTVTWFRKGESVLELPRGTERNATKIVEWVTWAAQPAMEDLENAEFTDNLALLRSSLQRQESLIVGFSREGQDDVRNVLNAAAERFRATNVFLYIINASPDGPLLKAYAADPSKDVEYTGALTTDEFVPWVKNLLGTAKVADLEEKKKALEEKKRELEEQAAPTDAASQEL